MQRGVLDLNARKQVDVARLANPRSWNTKSLATVPLGTPSPDKLSLALYSSISMGDGSASNNPWLQELPDPLSKVVWDNYLAVSPLLATQKKLSQGDVVRIEGQGFNFDAPILIMPKMNEKSVAIAVGYGHGAPMELC